MNATSSIEPWFVPLDIAMILCAAIVIILAVAYLSIIVLDRRCHTISMLLTANSCLTGFVSACILLSLYVFALINDLEGSHRPDSLCIFRGYLATVSGALLLCSFLVQALYRYVCVVHPTWTYWRSGRCQIPLILLTWLFAFLFCLAFLFTDDIVYNADNQICLIPLRFSFPIWFTVIFIYVIPVSMIMSLYMKLLHFVKTMSNHVTPVRTLSRARRQLRMARHTVILVTNLNVICFPYALFIFLSFFNLAPKYHFRIAFAFIGTSFVTTMVSLFYFNGRLRTSFRTRTTKAPNVVHIQNRA